MNVYMIAGGLLLFPPYGVMGAVAYSRSRRLAGIDHLESQTQALKARDRSLAAMGIGAAILVILLIVAIFTLNDFAVARGYFDFEVIREALPSMTRAFLRLNVSLAIVSELIVIPWSIAIALARGSKSKAVAPIRLMVLMYGDLFRGIPALLTLLIVGYGIPRSGIPVLSKISPFWAMVIALTLVYGAYVSEVIRSGISSIPRGQLLAARAIGLTEYQAARYVVLPQAIRVVTPALLGWFVVLIKDTSLVSVLGLLDAVNIARIGVVNYASLTPLVAAALLFLIATVPLTRLTDMLLARTQARMQGQ